MQGEQLQQRAVELAAEVGGAEAARQLGLNQNTVRSWLRRSGRAVSPARQAQTAAATVAKVLSVADRKARLADGLLDDAERLRAQLFAPVVVRDVKVVSCGKDAGSVTEIVDVALDRPRPADQRQIMVALAIAVDKVQILTGEATERIEQLSGTPAGEAARVIDELRARREAKTS